MKNWSTDITELQKDPKKYAIWRLESLINFGLDGEKLSKFDLVKYWSELRLDPAKRNFLNLLLNE